MQTHELQTQLRELVKKEDGAKSVVVGSVVFTTPTVNRDPNHKKCSDSKCRQCTPVPFTARQYLFINAYKDGFALEDAATKVGWTKEQAIRFLKSPKAQEKIKDKLAKDMTWVKWNTPHEVVAELDRVYYGEVQKTREQMEAAKMLFTFVKPASQEKQATKIEINIDPSAVQEAFRRQERIKNAIDAEVVKAA